MLANHMRGAVLTVHDDPAAVPAVVLSDLGTGEDVEFGHFGGVVR